MTPHAPTPPHPTTHRTAGLPAFIGLRRLLPAFRSYTRSQAVVLIDWTTLPTYHLTTFHTFLLGRVASIPRVLWFTRHLLHLPFRRSTRCRIRPFLRHLRAGLFAFSTYPRHPVLRFLHTPAARGCDVRYGFSHSVIPILRCTGFVSVAISPCGLDLSRHRGARPHARLAGAARHRTHCRTTHALPYATPYTYRDAAPHLHHLPYSDTRAVQGIFAAPRCYQLPPRTFYHAPLRAPYHTFTDTTTARAFVRPYQAATVPRRC